MSAHACGQDTEPLRHRGRQRNPLWLSVPLCLCVLLLSLFNPAQAYEVRDDAGRTTRFEAAPQRIVSLLPSLTETVCELGACARLVGVDRYSNWPEAVRKLPQVGGGLDPNIEAVVALRPDVVLVATSTRAADRLRALGLTVVALEPKTGADGRRVVHKLGQLLGAPDAGRVLRAIDAGVAAARSRCWLACAASGSTEVSPAPHAAGQSSFMGELLAQLGLRNIVGPNSGRFPSSTPRPWCARPRPHHGG